MVKEMHSKRWCFHMKIVAVGGRGKRVCKTAEVLSEEHSTWTVMMGEIPCQDRSSYSVCTVQTPYGLGG